MPTSPTVWILGAGASTEPAFASAPRIRFPCLDEFVATAAPSVVDRYAPLWAWLEGSLGITLADLRRQPPTLDVEELASELKAFGEMRWHVDVDEVERDFGYALGVQRPDTLLASFVADTLKPLHEPLLHGDRSQTYDRLCSNLDPTDTIVTFNYDLLLEASLHAHHEWNEAGGYSTLHPRAFFMADIDADERPPAAACEPKLLKLHGSLNWSLAARPTTDATEALDDPETLTISRYRLGHLPLAAALETGRPPVLDPFGILARSRDDDQDDDSADAARQLAARGRAAKLPPRLVCAPAIHTGSDLLRSRSLKQVWRDAHTAITRARRIVIVGYSFPPTDTHVLPMLRHALQANPGASLEIVDPNPEPILERLGSRSGQANDDTAPRTERAHATTAAHTADILTDIALLRLGPTRTASVHRTTLAEYLDAIT
jgi:hypothetical protein